MKYTISIRDFSPDDVQALANLYFNTIHRINIAHYTQEQVDVWAPKSSVDNTEGWAKKFLRTKPIIAVVGDEVVGFAEFEPNGHIDCFYVHHEWIGKGVGSALMREIFTRAERQNISRIFSEVSITAKPFFERQGFTVLSEQIIVRKGVELTNYKMERNLHPNKQELSFEITETPKSQDLDFLTRKINEETKIHGSAHPFAIFIKDKKGNILAGCNGSVIFGSIYTDQLWVHTEYRKTGLGRALMEKVHEYAKKQGCTMATVSTMNFQVPEFYEKLGYKIDFSRGGYNQDASCIFLSKSLNGERSFI